MRFSGQNFLRIAMGIAANATKKNYSKNEGNEYNVFKMSFFFQLPFLYFSKMDAFLNYS